MDWFQYDNGLRMKELKYLYFFYIWNNFEQKQFVS